MLGVRGSMGPTSLKVVLLVGALALAVPVVLGVLVARRPGRLRTRILHGVGVALAVLASQVLAVGALGLALNRDLTLFPTWGSVVDAVNADPSDALAQVGIAPQQDGLGLGPDQLKSVRTKGYAMHHKQPKGAAGVYRDYVVTGPKSGVTKKVVVWLPPGYDSGQSVANLPVMMVLGGAYVSLDWTVDFLYFGEEASRLIAAKKVKPFIAVFPDINVQAPQDTECVDYPSGVLAYSWLSTDIPHWVTQTFHSSTDRRRWSVQGWSLGGYCAAKLQASDPGRFVAAAAVQGYFEPEPDGTTGALKLDLMRSAALRNKASVSRLIRNKTPRDQLRLLAISSPSDAQSYDQTAAFGRAVAGRPGVRVVMVPGQGHTLAAWLGTQEQVLPFLLNHQP